MLFQTNKIHQVLIRDAINDRNSELFFISYLMASYLLVSTIN